MIDETTPQFLSRTSDREVLSSQELNAALLQRSPQV
jgi:hypothetical protein